MDKFLNGLQECIEKAVNKLYNEEKGVTSFQNVEVKVWKQNWSDTSIGFEQTWAGQALTNAYTVVVINHLWDECVVFHGMRFAYATQMTKEIMDAIAQQKLPGRSDFYTRKS